FGLNGMPADGFVPLLDSAGNLHRQLRIVIPVAAIITFAMPAIDAVSKQALNGVGEITGPPTFVQANYLKAYGNRYFALGVGLTFGLALANIQKDTPFLYFQF